MNLILVHPGLSASLHRINRFIYFCKTYTNGKTTQIKYMAFNDMLLYTYFYLDELLSEFKTIPVSVKSSRVTCQYRLHIPAPY
jgi:hypothetical protein